MQFKREKYLKQLIERMHNGEIKVITGIRRYGKSYLLEDAQRCHAGIYAIRYGAMAKSKYSTLGK